MGHKFHIRGLVGRSFVWILSYREGGREGRGRDIGKEEREKGEERERGREERE